MTHTTATTLGEKLREALEKKALATTINQWDDEDTTQTKQHVKDIPVIKLDNTKPKDKNLFSITTNSSRVTFDYIYNNMGKYNVQEVASHLSKQGHKEGTVASLCYQMLKQDMLLKNADGKLYTTLTAFVPIKAAKTLRNEAARKAEQEVKTTAKKVVVIKRRNANEGAAGIAALKQEEVGKRHDPYKWNADEVVAGLSVLQARELYLKLKEIFGG